MFFSKNGNNNENVLLNDNALKTNKLIYLWNNKKLNQFKKHCIFQNQEYEQ